MVVFYSLISNDCRCIDCILFSYLDLVLIRMMNAKTGMFTVSLLFECMYFPQLFLLFVYPNSWFTHIGKLLVSTMHICTCNLFVIRIIKEQCSLIPHGPLIKVFCLQHLLDRGFLSIVLITIPLFFSNMTLLNVIYHRMFSLFWATQRIKLWEQKLLTLEKEHYSPLFFVGFWFSNLSFDIILVCLSFSFFQTVACFLPMVFFCSEHTTPW